jgi:hypothetical protein
MLRITGFLSICVVTGVLVALLNLHSNISDTFSILAYLIIIFSVSLGFPVRVGALNKEYADLVYYCIAILAVLIIFVAKEGERKRLDLASRIEDATSQREEARQNAAAGADELRIFDYVASNKLLLLQWANGRVDLALKDAEAVRDFECRCSLEMSVTSDIRELGDCSFETALVQPGETGKGGVPDQRSNGFALAAIAASQRCDKENASLKAMESDRSQSPRKPETIFRLAGQLPMSGIFEAGDARIEIRKALSLLQLSDAERESARLTLTSNMKRLDSNKVAIEAELQNLQKEHDASVTKNKSGPGLLASMLYEKYWPYVLIAALGLKIARVQYLALRAV